MGGCLTKRFASPTKGRKQQKTCASQQSTVLQKKVTSCGIRGYFNAYKNEPWGFCSHKSFARGLKSYHKKVYIKCREFVATSHASKTSAVGFFVARKRNERHMGYINNKASVLYSLLKRAYGFTHKTFCGCLTTKRLHVCTPHWFHDDLTKTQSRARGKRDAFLGLVTRRSGCFVCTHKKFWRPYSKYGFHHQDVC